MQNDVGRSGELAELDRLARASAAQMSGENFPVALRVLPRGPRDRLTRVYGFARFVDDVGDEAAGDRLALLDRVAAAVDDQWAGRPVALEPVRALAPLTGTLTAQPFLDLVEANRRDQRVTSYPDFAALVDYCRYSADPVGRIVLGIAGAATPLREQQSDDVCTALQVLEHCQDVGEDARAGRVYLPQDDLRAAGVAPVDLRATTTSPALRAAVLVQVARAEALLASGAELVRGLSGWARFAVAGYVAGGDATAAALRRAGGDVLPATVRPTKARTALALARRLAGR